jgi:Protein of unknown function (DUF1018)
VLNTPRRSVIDKDGGRKADLAAIHIAKKHLGWDTDHYRDILFSVCRVKSSAELDFTGRKRFLAHLRACGWNGGTTAPAGARKPASPASRKPLTAPQRKMWSLWQTLADAGLVDSRKMPALVAFAHRQTGVDRLEWLTGAQEDLVIESLKAWSRRPKGAPT